jgi:hypothetical protein
VWVYDCRDEKDKDRGQVLRFLAFNWWTEVSVYRLRITGCILWLILGSGKIQNRITKTHIYSKTQIDIEPFLLGPSRKEIYSME